MMDKEYIYTVVKEDFRTGERAKRTRKYYTFKPLAVGGLYTHLGKGYIHTYIHVCMHRYTHINTYMNTHINT